MPNMNISPHCSTRSSTLARLFLVLAASNVVSGTVPQVNFDSMGLVGLAGSFAGLDIFDNTTSLSFDPSTSTLLSRASDGSLTRLGSTNAGGKIAAGCALGSTYYVGGTFSSINGTSATNIAAYSLTAGTFSPVGSNGPNGAINALFCDSTNNIIWAGGNFTSPGRAVATFSTGSQKWSAPPFTGLSGAAAEVLSITTNASANSLFFTGSFVTSFQGNSTTVINNTNNPNVPFSEGATPFSSSLVPVPLQGADINASPASSDPQFSNIENILCPAAGDGPGETWLAGDDSTAIITVQTFSQLGASGIRLGNTAQEGRSTTAFSITAIPQDDLLTLSFVDPATGANQTCSNSCPLAPANSSVPYQDFLFSSSQSLTGFQVTLIEWTGAGPGLHLMQLLSSGAFVSAVGSRNNISCFAPNPSNVTTVGNWVEKQVTTNIAATVQDVLMVTVPVGTPQSQSPSITWMPYVSASGVYNINMLVPGCTNFQDCALRTTVQVEVFPGGGLSPTVTTVDQTNTEDATVSIYNGPVFPSTPDFVATVTMTLASSPAGTGQGGQFDMVADRIELQLLSVNGNGSGSANGSTNATSLSNENGFGFLEWPISQTSNVDATQALPNSTETALDALSFQLFAAAGGQANIQATRDVIVSAVQHSSGAVFLGGNFMFTEGANIVVFKNGALTSLSGNGLNGPVSSLVLDGDVLYVGGSFTDTSVSSTGGKARGVVAYNVLSDTWSPMVSGVNGAATDLGFANGQVTVVGNFTNILTSPTVTGASAGGLAVWDTSNSTWANSGGFLSGSMTFIGNFSAPAKNQPQVELLAGNVAASAKFGANGFVMLSNGNNKDGEPQVTPLGAQLNSISASTNTSVTTRRRRSSGSLHSRFLPGLFNHIFARQSTSTPTPLPASIPAPAPSVLAGTFWTNTSNSHQVAILGGNFSFTTAGSSSQFNAVALYDLQTGTISGLTGNPIDGAVRSLFVTGDTLYIGGEFNVSGSSSLSGIAIYDLTAQQLKTSGLPPLQSSSGDVVVRSITASASKSDAVIVAGTFTSAGSTACVAICELSTFGNQWSQLGNGINGEVASVAYAGNNQDLLIASGSISLAGNAPANVAMFAFDNSTWTAVGNGADIPGPVTAVGVDDGNSSSIFAAGRSSDGSQAFLSFWNGQSWQSLGSAFSNDTNIAQLTMVPLQNTHSANSIIESNRMLFVSGSLSSSSFGNASSALFDGQNFFPYIVSTSQSGSPGSISSLFSSISNFSFNQRHLLAVGVVILISIAISAGVVFLLVLIGILWTLFARRDNSGKFDPSEFDDDDSTTHRPSSLLEHINAATRTTILGAAGFEAYNQEKQGEASNTGHDRDPFTADDYIRAQTPSDAHAGLGAGMEEQARPAHARYSFDGTGEGELMLNVGQELEVLDDRDHAWWYARDPNTGREGVVPAAYLY